MRGTPRLPWTRPSPVTSMGPCASSIPAAQKASATAAALALEGALETAGTAGSVIGASDRPLHPQREIERDRLADQDEDHRDVEDAGRRLVGVPLRAGQAHQRQD